MSKENELASALIIGVSASILQEDMEKSRQAGMNDYIVKPYHKEDILQILIKFMPNLFDVDTDNHLQWLFFLIYSSKNIIAAIDFIKEKKRCLI